MPSPPNEGTLVAQPSKALSQMEHISKHKPTDATCLLPELWVSTVVPEKKSNPRITQCVCYILRLWTSSIRLAIRLNYLYVISKSSDWKTTTHLLRTPSHISEVIFAMREGFYAANRKHFQLLEGSLWRSRQGQAHKRTFLTAWVTRDAVEAHRHTRFVTRFAVTRLFQNWYQKAEEWLLFHKM